MQNLKHLLVTISGIPDKVLQKAVAKSTEFEAIYGKHKKESEENLPADHCVDHMVVLIQSLLNFTAKSCQKSSEGDGVTCLTELQRQAGLFFAQQNWGTLLLILTSASACIYDIIVVFRELFSQEAFVFSF